MHPLRDKCKRQLLRDATDLHEIIPWAWPQYGSKYGDDLKDPAKWAEVAKIYFVPELTLVISNQFNLGNADAAREDLLRVNMWQYGPERVIQALRTVAAHIKHPHSYIPASLDFNGRTYQILD
jgi:hypothetical protein